MKELMLTDNIMDNFEYQCWVTRWHESRFGSRWNHYMIGQLTGYVANIMGGKSWTPEGYMVRSDDSSTFTDPTTDDSKQQTAAYQMILEFQGKAAADKWRGEPVDAERNK